MKRWRRRGPIEANEKAGTVTFTQLQRDKSGNLMFVEDWIGMQPSWFGLVLQMRALEMPMPFVVGEQGPNFVSRLREHIWLRDHGAAV